MKNFIKNIKDSKSKTAELVFLLAACLMMVSLLSGCNTTQTLAAQFGVAPLPTAVARKLYGTCGECDLNPNCPLCKSVQGYNRKLAGAPASERVKYRTLGTSYRNHANAIYNPYGYNYPQLRGNTQRNSYGNGYGNKFGYNSNQNPRYQQPQYPNYYPLGY